MRLIGGSVSDQAIKRVSDGSAFSAAGGEATPDLIGFGTPTTPAAFSNIPNSIDKNWGVSGEAYETQHETVTWADGSIGYFFREDVSPYDIHYLHFTVDSNGVMDTESTLVDLGGDFSAMSATNHGMYLVDMGNDKVAVIDCNVNATRNIRLNVYSKDGGGLSKIGSEWTTNYDWASNSCIGGTSFGRFDDNTLVISEARSDSQLDIRAVNIDATRNSSAWTATGKTVQTNAYASFGSFHRGKATDSNVYFYNEKGIIIRATVSAGTTPSIGASFATNPANYGNYPVQYGATPRARLRTHMRHDVELGRLFTASRHQVYGSQSYYGMAFFTGDKVLGEDATNDTGGYGSGGWSQTISQHWLNRQVDESGHGSYHSGLISIDYNEDTKWERFVGALRYPHTWPNYSYQVYSCSLNWESGGLMWTDINDAAAVAYSSSGGAANKAGNCQAHIVKTASNAVMLITQGDTTDPPYYTTIPLTL